MIANRPLNKTHLCGTSFCTLSIILIILTLSPITSLFAETVGKKAANILNILKEFHYRELILEENEIKWNFIKKLDPAGLFFLEADVTELMAVRLDPNGFGRERSIPFFDRAASRFRARMEEALGVIDSTIKTGFDYHSDDKLRLILEEREGYAGNKSERISRWKKYLKYRILTALYFRIIADGVSPDYATLPGSYEPELRAAAGRREKGIIYDILNHPEGYSNLLSSLFLNILTWQYDPHSAYFTSKEKKSFESSLSSSSLSFGIFLTKSLTGDIRIERVVPGGPAWKSAKLNKSDLLLRMEFPASGNRIKSRIIEVSDLNLEAVEDLLDRSGGDRVILTVKKSSGLIERASLLKEKIVVEENMIDSFILDGDKKIGYIYLPSFYTEWDSPGAPGCANDVAREIVKLKKEKIDGLIIDLRGNGGGSLMEAMNLSGIFIDEGPLFIGASRREKPVVFKDPSRGTIYDGPLVVLVNGQSASASEFFAAIMKEYSRAVIVGGKTFGKASSQIILPVVEDMKQMDRSLRNRESSLEYIKITTNLFYGLSGRTHQNEGVTPHVILPDLISQLIKMERELEHSLPATAISKTVTFQKLNEIPEKSLSQKSLKRVSRDDNFRKIVELSSLLRETVTGTRTIPLNIPDFFRDMNRQLDLYTSLEKSLKRASSSFEVINNVYDSEIIRIDPYRKERNEQLKRQIHEDLYIDESYKIMSHYIRLMD
jgi:carboxyl-terminal processing protease